MRCVTESAEEGAPVVTLPTDSDKWKEAERQYRKLKSAGHAVVFDTVTTHDGQLVSVQIHHYLTCRACKEGQPTQ